MPCHGTDLEGCAGDVVLPSWPSREAQLPPPHNDPSCLDALLARLRVSSGKQAPPWAGGWWALDFSDRSPPSEVITAIMQATASLRPTRIVLTLSPGCHEIRCNISLSDVSSTVVLFQNAAAAALEPLAALVPSLRRHWKVLWGQAPAPCPPPPSEAFLLHRRPSPRPDTGVRAWL